MNYKNFTKNEIIMLKLIILLRRDLMGWKIITILAYFLKLYGIFLISNCILIEIDNLEVSNYLRVLTMFGSDLKETKFFIKYYNVLFFIVVSIALAYIAAVTYYLTGTEVSAFYPPEKNEQKLTKGITVLEKFISYTTFGLIFLSQHLIEFLSLSIVTRLNTLPTSTIADPQIALVQTQIANFSKSLLINPLIYLILGVVVIVIINLIIFFYFYYLNEPLLNYDSTLKYTKLRHFPILIALMTNFQGIVLYDTILDQTSVTAFHLILTCLTFLFGILFLIKHYSALIYFNAMKISTIFMINYGVISCFVNVIYKYTLKTPGINLSATNFLLMLFNEVIIAYGATKLLAYYKTRTYFNKLSRHLFKKDKRIKNEILLFLGEVMKNSMTHPKDLLKLANIFSQHSIDCKSEDCDCKKMDLDKLYSTVNKLAKETSQVSLKRSLQLKTFSKIFSELICFVECVIVNSISKIKPEEITNDSLILFHVDYVSYFKRSYLHANYLISAYGNMLHLKFNFNDKVKFFLLKNNNFERYNKEVMHDNFFVKFYRQFKKIKKMKKLILNNCININEVISIRNSYLVNEVFTKSDRILELSQNMKRNDKRLMKEIIQYPQCLRNSQFCYWINNYYSMNFKTEMPKKLLDLLSFYNITKFTAEHIVSQEYPFPEMNMMNPIIVSIKDKENFRIKYACSELCEKLNYKREDLIGQYISVFLPGIMEKPHKTILKNKILIQKLYEIKKKTFILSHDNYYVPAEFYSSFSTNFSGEIEIIINIQLYESKDRKYNKYFFLIDDQFNIISHSKNFEENYFVTRSIIQKTKLTIISMLNLNYEKIMNRFQSNIDLITSVHLENAENFVSVLHSVDFTKEISELKKFGKEKVCIKINKSKLISTLEKIKLCLEEYDSDKKVEIRKLKQMIQEFGRIKRKINSSGRITGYMKGESVKKIFITNDDLEDGDNFLFELELKQMGGIHFYYGKLYEKKQSNGIYSTKRRITNESLNSFYQLSAKNESILKDTGKKFTKPSLFCTNALNSEINYDEKLNTKNSYTALYSSSADLMSDLKFDEKKNPKKNKLKNASPLSKNKANDNVKKISASLIRSFFSKLNEKFVLSTLILLLLCHAGFFLYVLNYSINILTESENIFFINYYTLSLKSSIFYTSSAILSSCIIADMKSQNLPLTDFPLSYDLIRSKLTLRLNEVLNGYMGIHTYLGKVNTGFNSIYDILNKQDEYYLIYKDWSQYSRQSTLENEVIYFRNYIYPLITSTDLEQCMLTPFYGGLFYSDEKVNTDEFTLFYIIKNAFTNFRKSLENISDISSQMIIANEVRIKSYFSSTNYLLLLLSILVLTFMYVEIKILEFNIKWSIEKLLQFDKKIFIRLHDKLDIFIQFLKDVDKESCKKFESIKNSKMHIDYYGFNPPVVNLSPKKQDEQIDLENSEMTVESLFIGKISKIIIIFGLVFYLSVTVAQLILRSRDLNNIVYANKISISMLRRFSDLIELDIYYKLAVIQNDPYYVNVTQADYDALSTLGIYDPFVQSSDELYQESMNSYFSYVYFKTKQDIQNIDDYMLNYKSASFMNNTRAQEEMLSGSNFCEEMSNFFFMHVFNCPSAAKCASLNATSIQICEIPLNNNGFGPGLIAILTNLKNYYLDYIKLWESNPGQVEVSKYIYNSDILSATMNIEGIYKIIHSNVVYTINQDMINLYNQARLNESLFTFIQITFDFGFLAFIILAIFLKLKKHSYTLKKFYENIEKKFNRKKLELN